MTNKTFDVWFSKAYPYDDIDGFSIQMAIKSWQAAQADQATIIGQLQADNEKLRDKAIAVFTKWNKDKWQDLPHTALFIHELEEALQPESQPETTVQLFRPVRENWEGFESPWEHKVPAELLEQLKAAGKSQLESNHICRYSRAMQSHPRKCLDCNEAESQPESVVKDSLTVQNHLNEQESFELYMQVTKWSPDTDSEAAFRYAYRHGVKYAPTIRNNQTTQKPLSDEEIIEIKFKEGLGNWYNFARAIEQHHGIGE